MSRLPIVTLSIFLCCIVGCESKPQQETERSSLQAAPSNDEYFRPDYEEVEHEEESEFSHIRLRRKGSIRTLLFVRDSGLEVIETQVDINNRSKLLQPYTRGMFSSYLFRLQQKDVLLVGLGGGAMVHFLQDFDPDVRIDAVEIDPAVVDIAKNYFEIQTSPSLNVITADAFSFLETTRNKYDVIYFDVFLKPSDSTDSTGALTRMKTAGFYRDLQKRLTPDGQVVFNLNTSTHLTSDNETIRDAFPRIYGFGVATGAKFSAVVVIATTNMELVAPEILLAHGMELDAGKATSVSFEKLARSLLFTATPGQYFGSFQIP